MARYTVSVYCIMVISLFWTFCDTSEWKTTIFYYFKFSSSTWSAISFSWTGASAAWWMTSWAYWFCKTWTFVKASRATTIGSNTISSASCATTHTWASSTLIGAFEAHKIICWSSTEVSIWALTFIRYLDQYAWTDITCISAASACVAFRTTISTKVISFIDPCT